MASQIGEKTGGGAQKFVSSHCRPVCKWLYTDVFVLCLLLLSLPGCSDTCIASAPSPETALVGSRCGQVWCNICLHPAPGCGAKHKKPSVILLLWERFLPGITNNWWQPWEVQEGQRAVLGLEHRGERNWSPEYQQAAERGLSSARAEQHCTQEVGSCWYWGLVLTSIMAQHRALLL